MGEQTQASPFEWVHSGSYTWKLTDYEGTSYEAGRSYDNDGVSRWVIAWACQIGAQLYITIGGTYPTAEAAKVAIERIAEIAPASPTSEPDVPEVNP